MNPTQTNQVAQPELITERSGHHSKRKWHDSLLLEQTELTEGNEGHIKKVPHTTPSISVGDDTQKTDMEEEDEEDMKIKRKAQNRAAQRAFRERKERYVKDLEIKIKQTQDNHVFATNQLYQENHHLRAIIYRLEAENTTLKGMMPLSTNKSSDLLASLGLMSPPQQQLLSGLTSLPPLSTFYTPSPMDVFNPNGFLPFPTTSSLPGPRHPKPLAAKPPVPILPQQQQPQPQQQQQQQQQHHIISTKSSSSSNQQKEPKPIETSQHQEFTFSISTPETLRAHTSGRNVASDPIELIPLCHPDQDHRSFKTTQSNNNNSNNNASSGSSPSTAPVNSPHDTLDNDETNNTSFVSFLDGYDAFERLYVHQDPSLFDDPGLNLSMPSRHNISQGVKPPIEEEPTMILKDKKMDTLMMKGSGSADDLISLPSVQQDLQQQQQHQQHQHQQQQVGQHPQRVVSVTSTTMEDDEKTPIWQKITEHAQNNKFSVDHLVEAVRSTTTSKRKNKLLVDEWELEAMVNDLNYYL
ncbi:hypothetical protein BC941DRAFT_425678 [Chlamydoabsidia padenii]|nr:hypothetical protein BC941DRAFT_425678 [Chlamydoabsidia padenii]